MKLENETKMKLELLPYVPTIIRCYLSKKSFRNLNWFLKLRRDVNFLSTWECDLTEAPNPPPKE